MMMTILRSVTKASTTLGTPIWFNQRSMFSSVLKKRLWCSSHTWINLAAYWLPVNLSRTRRTIPCLPLYKCSYSYQCTNKWRYLTIYIVFFIFYGPICLNEWYFLPSYLLQNIVVILHEGLPVGEGLSHQVSICQSQ